MILITSVFNKDKNNYYCNIFLEKASYELHKKYFFLYKVKMIYYDRIDISGGIDVSKTSESRV